ncbi:MAG TPA: hypothetical protein VF040_06730 [Ktedonobacterales bacterium]
MAALADRAGGQRAAHVSWLAFSAITTIITITTSEQKCEAPPLTRSPGRLWHLHAVLTLGQIARIATLSL